jgi:hypothetical protein
MKPLDNGSALPYIVTKAVPMSKWMTIMVSTCITAMNLSDSEGEEGKRTRASCSGALQLQHPTGAELATATTRTQR